MTAPSNLVMQWRMTQDDIKHAATGACGEGDPVVDLIRDLLELYELEPQAVRDLHARVRELASARLNSQRG